MTKKYAKLPSMQRVKISLGFFKTGWCRVKPDLQIF